MAIHAPTCAARPLQAVEERTIEAAVAACAAQWDMTARQTMDFLARRDSLTCMAELPGLYVGDATSNRYGATAHGVLTAVQRYWTERGYNPPDRFYSWDVIDPTAKAGGLLEATSTGS